MLRAIVPILFIAGFVVSLLGGLALDGGPPKIRRVGVVFVYTGIAVMACSIVYAIVRAAHGGQ